MLATYGNVERQIEQIVQQQLRQRAFTTTTVFVDKIEALSKQHKLYRSAVEIELKHAVRLLFNSVLLAILRMNLRQRLV